MDKECKYCGLNFKLTRKDRIYCSSNCNHKMWNVNNPKRRIELNKEWRDNNKNKIIQLNKEWKKRNPDLNKARHKRYYNRHKGIHNLNSSLWRKNNRLKCNDYKRIEREREKKIIRKFSINMWLQKKNNMFGVCPNCNIYVGIGKLTMDHIYPLSKAYKDYIESGIKRIYTIDDVQPLCKSCNSSKRNKVVV